MNAYKPTVYEQIVQDFLHNKLKEYTAYSAELEKRGYNWEQFAQYVEDVKYAAGLTEDKTFNVVAASNEAKKSVAGRNDIVTFSLTDDEKKIVLEAEDRGRIKNGEVIEYDGCRRKIKGVDYLNLPKETDAIVIFSGHPGSGAAAVEAWYNDYKKTGKRK